MEDRQAVISVKHLAKTYRYYKNNQQRLMHRLFGMDTGRKSKVLKDVSFEIYKGERVGLLGVVGSGRTTLMEILMGTIKADKGEISINGDITAVMDNRLGFDNGLSGRDNLHIMGTLLGWQDSEIRAREDDLIAKAKLKKLIDQPVKLYPKGAAARLGFMLSTEERPDIMLFDDAFSFGGPKYDQTCAKRLDDLFDGKDNTLLLTITNMSIGRKLCERGIVLHKGKICFDGPYDDAVEYFKLNCRVKTKKKKKEDILEGLQPEEDHSDSSGDNSDVGI